MKRYTKNDEIKTRRQIVIHKDGMATYNPTEEMIFADGWEEYTQPQPTEKQVFTTLLSKKKIEIDIYDKSENVNQFYIDNTPMWLDKETRTGLKLRFESEKAVGVTDTTLWYNGVQYPLNLDAAIQMLYALEIYASKCYDNTQYHISQINKLDKIEDIEAYDYTTGYPEKLYF